MTLTLVFRHEADELDAAEKNGIEQASITVSSATERRQCGPCGIMSGIKKGFLWYFRFRLFHECVILFCVKKKL